MRARRRRVSRSNQRWQEQSSRRWSTIAFHVELEPLDHPDDGQHGKKKNDLLSLKNSKKAEATFRKVARPILHHQRCRRVGSRAGPEVLKAGNSSLYSRMVAPLPKTPMVPTIGKRT